MMSNQNSPCKECIIRPMCMRTCRKMRDYCINITAESIDEATIQILKRILQIPEDHIIRSTHLDENRQFTVHSSMSTETSLVNKAYRRRSDD